MSTVDKAAVREDYINGLSVRQLADKYEIPKSTVGRWVQQYGWLREVDRQERKLHKNKKRDTVSGTAPAGEEKRDAEEPPVPREPIELPVCDDFEAVRTYVLKLLGKADQLLELDDALAPRDLKSLSSMLLDVRTLLNILSPREAAEQEMRLAALRRQAQDEQKQTAEVTVRFVDTEGAEV